MRIPPKPPPLADLFNDQQGLATRLAKLMTPEVEAAVQKANDRYLHWDKIKVRPAPEGLTADEFWYAIKMRRRSSRQKLPLSFTEQGKNLWYMTPPRHLEWIHELDKFGGGHIGVSGSALFGDDNEKYLFSSLMEEAIASSQLEGASTTRKIAKDMLRTNRRPATDAERMIVNNYRAIMEVRELKGEPLTPELLCELQSILTNGLEKPELTGRFRRPDEFVRVELKETQEVVHVPPPGEELEWRIKEVCDFANTISNPFVHPIVKAAVLHFALGYIHPFNDGNGRTARAIFYWYLLKADYWVFEYFPISRVLARAPAQYGRAYLRTESDGGDVTYFIQYHVEVLLKAMRDFHIYLGSQRSEVKEAVQLLERYPGLNMRQRSLVHDAIKNPGTSFTIRGHKGKSHITYPTAHADLKGLVKIGLLTGVKVGKQLVFFPADNLKKKLNLPNAVPQPQVSADTIPRNLPVTRRVDAPPEQPQGLAKSLFD